MTIESVSASIESRRVAIEFVRASIEFRSVSIGCEETAIGFGRMTKGIGFMIIWVIGMTIEFRMVTNQSGKVKDKIWVSPSLDLGLDITNSVS